MVLLVLLAMISVMPWAEILRRHLYPDSVNLITPGTNRTHKILVVDGSLSMAVKLGDGTAFDRARTLAERVVREAARGDGFSVVLMQRPAAAHCAGTLRRHRPRGPGNQGPTPAARQCRRCRHPQYGRKPAAPLAREVRGTRGLFPHGFAAIHLDPQAARPGVGSAAKDSGQTARTIFIDVGEDGINNLAVTSLTLGSPLATAGAVLPITTTVFNYGSEARDGVRVELWVGKARMTAADPPLEMRLVYQLGERVNRGSNTFSFSYKFSTPGTYVLQVRLEGDALELDDTRSAVLTVKKNVPVMLVDGKPGEREILDRGAEWLHQALYPDDGRPGPVNSPFRVKVVNESEFADAGLGSLTDYDCVFFCDVPRLAPPEVRRLETHPRQGGGVVFGLGDQVDAGAYNDLLFRNGQGLLPARLLKKMAAPRDVLFHFAMEGKGYQEVPLEPPLDAFGNDNDRLSLQAARFWKYYQVVPAEKGGPAKILSFMAASARANSQGKETEGLPQGDSGLLEWHPPSAPLPGDDAAAGREKGQPPPRSRGRVILMTSTLNGDWTSWPASPSYPALFQELTRFAVAGRLREHAVTVGEPLEEFLAHRRECHGRRGHHSRRPIGKYSHSAPGRHQRSAGRTPTLAAFTGPSSANIRKNICSRSMCRRPPWPSKGPRAT